jgi:hypothetical protein
MSTIVVQNGLLTLSQHHQKSLLNHHQAHSAQCELDRTNQGGNQVILLAHCEFDNNHRGLCHTLADMTIVYGKCSALHFLEECAASSSCTNL